MIVDNAEDPTVLSGAGGNLRSAQLSKFLPLNRQGAILLPGYVLELEDMSKQKLGSFWRNV